MPADLGFRLRFAALPVLTYPTLQTWTGQGTAFRTGPPMPPASGRPIDPHPITPCVWGRPRPASREAPRRGVPLMHGSIREAAAARQWPWPPCSVGNHVYGHGTMNEFVPLRSLKAGMQLLVGGSRLYTVDEQLASAFAEGDELRFAESTGELLHIPRAELQVAREAVSRSLAAFRQMSTVTSDQIAAFYSEFADRLANDELWSAISEVNARDVEDAKRRGRSTTRLAASDKMRREMILGLRGWVGTASKRGQILETVQHEGWKAELIGAELGVVAFVFEGRPNVLADATGVLRSGNTVVFRIGRDALGTARAIMDLGLRPALLASGLPEGAVCLVDSSSHAAGWALFCDSRLSLAVARGSGRAVDTLGSLAQSAGVPVSLHGTGGAWLLAADSASAERLEEAVVMSLDRKVCNSLNTCCIVRAKAPSLVAALIAGLTKAGQRRGQAFKLHVAEGDEAYVPESLRAKRVTVRRAEGDVEELQVESLPTSELGKEWEWEDTPEVSLKIVDDIPEAVALFNRYSPQFVAGILTEVEAEREACFAKLNAPFVSDGFTRWVDGQYALRRPELGLSNWQHGRLFGRGAILSGDSVFTVRLRASGFGRGVPKDR